MEKRALSMGVLLMLFLGLIYAWSLFAAPLEQAFNWDRSQTSATFSISMISFCLGSIASGIILRKYPPNKIIVVSAALFLAGFLLVAQTTTLLGLYLSYGVLCGLGVGLSYNAILSTVPKWYPDRVGFVTGILLMGMGLGSLVLGTVLKRVMDLLPWATTFRVLAVVFFAVFLLGSFYISHTKPLKKAIAAQSSIKAYMLLEMLKTVDFWMIFLWSTIASAVGLGIVSNASYMASELSVSNMMLPLLVGMVSVGNGVGRLIFGALVDKLSGKMAMAISNLASICGLLLVILANKTGILYCMVIGFVLLGIAYGAPSTLSAALVKKKFGEANYPQNLSAVILALIPASLIGPTISASIYQQAGRYLFVYVVLLGMALLAFLPVQIYERLKKAHKPFLNNESET